MVNSRGHLGGTFFAVVLEMTTGIEPKGEGSYSKLSRWWTLCKPLQVYRVALEVLRQLEQGTDNI